MRALEDQGVKTIFGYPGGSIMPVYDALYDHLDKLNHILVRHEQGAAHAAEGFARVSGQVGVCLVTSGPGATNTVTGIADAMIDSTPIVVIAGQVGLSALGTDAFQEVDWVGLTQPISKWSYMIRDANDIAQAVARAFYIARSGRPGPVVLDFPKSVQTQKVYYRSASVDYIRSYDPVPDTDPVSVEQAAALINGARKPFMLVGQGVELGNAQQELIDFIEKADIPCGTTMLGLSAIPYNHRLNKGMLGMHGNIGPNVNTNKCDVLIAVGMRFSDRVTGFLPNYAKQAKIIHFDIDPAEINKNVKVDVAVLGDCKDTLKKVGALLKPAKHTKWVDSFSTYEKLEYDKVIHNELHPSAGPLTYGEVVNTVAEATNGAPGRTVCVFIGDGGMQMTIEELGVVMEHKVPVKVIILNNHFLGNVRQWQELFFNRRYSFTHMMNPDYMKIAEAYGVPAKRVQERADLQSAVEQMLATDGPFILEACVAEEENVLPMTPPGSAISEIMLEAE